MDTLGKRLRHLREQNRLLQIDVAKNFKISNKTWSDYERDRSEPDASLLVSMAEYFNVSTDELSRIERKDDKL